MNVGLLTGGRWHDKAYKFLIKKNYKVTLFDDKKKCYISQKYSVNPIPLKKANEKRFESLFFWSPTNDIGSALADFLNKNKNFTRSNIFIKGKFDKKKFIKNEKLSQKKTYFLKARNGSGSRNIKIWNNKKFDKNKFYLEEFYRGLELSIEVISRKSVHKIIAISLRVLVKKKSAAAIILFPEFIKKKLTIQIKKKFNDLKIKNGVSHVECILTNNKKLKFIDINLRCGGYGVSEYLIKHTTGIDLYEVDFNLLKNNNFKPLKKKNSYGFLLFESTINKHFKHKLSKYKKKYNYIKMKNEDKKIQSDEIDLFLTAILYGSFNKKIFFYNFLRQVFKKNTLEKINYAYKTIISL